MIEDMLYDNELAIKAIFKFGIEPDESCFYKFNKEQKLNRDAKLTEPGGLMFMFIPDKHKYRKSKEICIVSETEKKQILKGAQIIENYCRRSGRYFESFEDKLKFAASMLPKAFYDGTKFSN